MRCRPTVPGDAKAVAEVFLAARREMTYLPQLHTDEETRLWIRDTVVSGLEVWVADDGGRVVGFVALGDELLHHLYVAPESQGRGVGTSLLSVAKERRADGLRLWTFQKNTGARRFYERHAFRLVRMTDGRHNEEREPDVLYQWRPVSGLGPAGSSIS